MAAWKLEWSRRHVRCVLRVVMCLLIVVVIGIKGNSTAINPVSSMIDDMDSTTALPQNTTPGVIQGEEASSATDCFLSIPSDEKENVDDMIKEVFQDNAVFIYFKLNFANPQDIYDNSSNVIDPSTWVWAVEGKGELLLSYPFDFEQLSLGTLTYGVVTVEVPIITPSDGCFQEAADDDKQQIIARFVGSLVQSANETLNLTNKEFYANKGSMVCLEKLKSDLKLKELYRVPLLAYYVLQGSTLYECWAGDQNPFETESTLVKKHDFLGAFSALGFLLALFSPLAASFFIRKQKPFKKDGKEYIALNADLPYGLKYLLCFSFHDYPAIFVFRGFVYIAAIMIIQFIPYTVSYVMRGDAFERRLYVAQELFANKKLVILSNILFLAIALLFLLLCFYDKLAVNPTDRFPLYMHLPKELHVLQNPIPSNSILRTFMYTMWYCTHMAVNPALWIFWFSLTWNGIYYLLGGFENEENKNRCRLLVTFILFIIVSPFSLAFFCVCLLSDSVPLIYIILLTNDKLNFCIKAPFGYLFASFFIPNVCSAIAVLLAAFIYIAELIGYTFIGCVLNTEFVSPLAFIIVTVVGYLITTSSAFYDKYCVLLRRTIEIAEQLDKEVKMVPTEVDGDQYSDRSATDQESNSLICGVENRTAQPNLRKLVEYKEGIPFIPVDLFNLVITKCQPIYLEVATILFKLIVTGVVITFGLTTITSTDRVSALPGTVRFFASVVVAGVVPLLMLILKSRGEQENEDILKARYQEAVIKQYAELINQPSKQPTERTSGDSGVTMGGTSPLPPNRLAKKKEKKSTKRNACKEKRKEKESEKKTENNSEQGK